MDHTGTTHLWEVTWKDPRDRRAERRTFDLVEGTMEEASALVDRASRELPSGVYLWLSRA